MMTRYEVFYSIKAALHPALRALDNKANEADVLHALIVLVVEEARRSSMPDALFDACVTMARSVFPMGAGMLIRLTPHEES